MSLNIQPIQIVGTVEIQKPKTLKEKTITYNATSLKNIGKIQWLIEINDNLSPMSTDPIFSITLKNDPQILCLNISDSLRCDKLFIIPKISDSIIGGKIAYEQDKEDPLFYSFRLQDKIIKNGEIVSYEWKINNVTVSTQDSFSYRFPNYGDARILLLIGDSAGNITTIEERFSLISPLLLTKTKEALSFLRVTNAVGKSLIDSTYNMSLRAYAIRNIATPMNIRFDATDVKVENYGYELTSVEWDFDGDDVFETKGMIKEYELIEEKRYVFQVRYTFVNENKSITSTLSEKVIFEPEKKDLSLTMKLTQDSEYAPTTIHVDGSASIPKQGTITKFMYDF